MSTLSILALSVSKIAGVTHARIDYPLTTINQLLQVSAHFESGTLTIPEAFKTNQGIFILHRQFMNNPNFNAHIERIAQGWVIVSEIDDDPHHWQGFINNDFYAYRGVHAVTVSTEPLAQMIRQWNPNVQIFPNAIFELPHIPSQTTPKQSGQVRIFFGALNRLSDWQAIHPQMLALTQAYPQIHWVIVHEQAVFDSLPADCQKSFHPTLNHNDYLKVMAECDISLLPLNDTPFNRLKSDLKLIESCASGVVPVCSPIVYADHPKHQEVALFANTAQDWYEQIKTLIENPDHLANYKQKGLGYVKAERLHSQQAPLRETYYRQLVDNQTTLEAQRQARIGAR